MASPKDPEKERFRLERLRAVIASPEYRERMSLALKGRVFTPEHRANLSRSWEGDGSRRTNLLAVVKSDEYRLRMSHVMKGRVFNAEWRAKLSAAGKGKIITPQQIAKRLATIKANGGYVTSEATKEKLRLIGIGRKMSPESVAKGAAKRLGQKRSVEFCKRMSALKMGVGVGRHISEENRQKLRAFQTGRKKSIEERRKLSEAKLRYWKQRGHTGFKAARMMDQFEYKVWRDGVLKRDRNSCVSCGTKTGITAHHIKPWRSHPELRYSISNGSALCGPCHAKIDPWFARFHPHLRDHA